MKSVAVVEGVLVVAALGVLVCVRVVGGMCVVKSVSVVAVVGIGILAVLAVLSTVGFVTGVGVVEGVVTVAVLGVLPGVCVVALEVIVAVVVVVVAVISILCVACEEICLVVGAEEGFVAVAVEDALPTGDEKLFDEDGFLVGYEAKKEND